MSNPMIGEIRMFGGNFTPRYWAFCSGQLLPIRENPALFSILGTTYGGDGRTTFALPDMRGRAPVHSGGSGAGPGLTHRPLGAKGGEENVVLNSTHLPSHTHTASGTVTPQASSGQGDSDTPESAFPAAHASDEDFSESADTAMGQSPVSVTVNNTGGNLQHNNMQPWLAVNFIIALFGVFPSRN
ncbi:tail fiber protein [bacterium]|nr:tail fiber protein [Akkermansiaceae bacterium]MDB4488220.1 tail fiber protein [bacterium]MDB4541902.1 tail fiber protein [bacterium]